MIIDEAIRILKVIEEDFERLNEPYSKDAVRLGIEALQEVARARRLGPPLERYRLPGETEVL